MPLEIDLIPLQMQYLSKTAAGDEQETNGGRGVFRDPPGPLKVGERHPEPMQLRIVEKPLPFFLAEFFDPDAGIAPVCAIAALLHPGHQLTQERQCAVGVVRSFFEPVMKLGNVAAAHLVDLEVAQHGAHVEPNKALIAAPGGGLELRLDVVLEKDIDDLRDLRGCIPAPLVAGNVSTPRHLSSQLDRVPPGLLRRDAAVDPEIYTPHAPTAAAKAILIDIRLPPLRRHLDPESGQGIIPVEDVLLLRHDALDSHFRDLHSAPPVALVST